MEGKACSSGSAPQMGKSFCLGDVYETHMNSFYEETSQRETTKKLTAALMMKLASLVPCGLLNHDMKNHVEESLLKLAPLFHTPNHPDYALMIYMAIDELERNRGSTNEEAISKLIKEKFEDLPLAHDLLLRHYLKKLCENREIVCRFGNCYTLAEDARRKWKRRQAFWNGAQGNKFNGIEDQRLRAEGFGKKKLVKRVHEHEQQDRVNLEDDSDRPPGF